MNRFECIGRLTRDPELVTTTNGINVCKFTIAVNRRVKENNEQQADFFNVVAWRTLGDNIKQYCKKGSKVFIAGQLQNRSWDKQDGTKGYTIDINATECEFLDTKQSETEQKPTEEFTPVQDNDDLPF